MFTELSILRCTLKYRLQGVTVSGTEHSRRQFGINARVARELPSRSMPVILVPEYKFASPRRRDGMNSWDHGASSPAPHHVHFDTDRLRALLLATGLSESQGARALGVEEKTLLSWCQPNGKFMPPSWAIQALSLLVARRRLGWRDRKTHRERCALM
jgi:hypothetical protein